LIFQQHNDGIFEKKFKILIRHKLIGWNYNTWAACGVFVHPGHDVIIFIWNSWYLHICWCDRKWNGTCRAEGNTGIYTKPYSARHQTITLDFDLGDTWWQTWWQSWLQIHCCRCLGLVAILYNLWQIGWVQSRNLNKDLKRILIGSYVAQSHWLIFLGNWYFIAYSY